VLFPWQETCGRWARPMLAVALVAGRAAAAAPPAVDLAALSSPVLLRGTETSAYRDPAVAFDRGIFHLFYTYVRSDGEQRNVRMAIGVSLSSDLKTWTAARVLTPLDPRLNFSRPGSVFRYGGGWCMCVSSYPRPNGETYGNKDARIWLMRSPDLERWSEPELLRVKGPDVAPAAMGRMIDAYIFQDKDDPKTWWCLFKQDGKVHRSRSSDLVHWTYVGKIAEGENACVIVKDGSYYLFSAPKNGIAVARSRDGQRWEPLSLLTLGQSQWPWAQGRITAGFVLDLHDDPRVGKYLMFFHGTGPEPEPTVFDTRACIGLAWSDDLVTWRWPGSP
jgi:hypothetical protein